MGKDLIVYINGKYLPALKASVSVFDRGLNYGDGLFETLRAYKGKPFALELHLARLKKSADNLGIPITTKESLWRQAIGELIALNSLRDIDSYIRITVTRGVDFGGLEPHPGIKPTQIIINKPLNPSIKYQQEHGIRGTIVTKTYSFSAAFELH